MSCGCEIWEEAIKETKQKKFNAISKKVEIILTDYKDIETQHRLIMNIVKAEYLECE